MATLTAPNVNISFEPHLFDTLKPLRNILPPQLARQLDTCLTDPPPKTVPYAFLQSVSQWARSPAASSLVNPNDYTMIALLAGSVTSPERMFGDYVPPPDPEDLAGQKSEERKQITTLLNALLSIAGSAFAAFWASQHTGWKFEWRVLFGFFVAIVVAVSEAVLYLIWQSRRSDANKPKKRRLVARHKKVDPDITIIIPGEPPVEEVLRRRKP